MEYEKVKDFLHDILIPGFISLVDSDIYLTVHDLNYRVIFTTNKAAKSNGLSNWQESVGTSYANPPEDRIDNILLKNKNFSREDVIAAANKIFTLQKEAIEYRKTIKFIDMLPYNNKFEGFLSNISPIFLPGTNHIAGIITISDTLPLIGVEDLFKLKENIINPNTLNSVPELTNHLSPRQWEIVFLLSIGINQAEIAEILSIKRGTVSKIMSDGLFDKFNVYTKEELIQESIKQGFNKILPKSLWKHYIILIK